MFYSRKVNYERKCVWLLFHEGIFHETFHEIGVSFI